MHNPRFFTTVVKIRPNRPHAKKIEKDKGQKEKPVPRMPGEHTFYDGSKVFEPFAQRLDVRVDQVNLVISQIASIFFAFIFYNFLKPIHVSRTVRLIYLIFPGLFLCYFCFGGAIKHLLSLVLISYALMLFSPSRHVHRFVFLFAMGYLIFIHWYRFYILTAYYIDVTGPMMVLVQKTTVMAFSLHDGTVKTKEELNEIQKREAISQVPNILEYLAYMFQFQTVLTGPLCFYTDFQRFISGENLKVGGNKTVTPWKPAISKIIFSLISLLMIVYFGSSTDPHLIARPIYLAMPWYKWAIFFFVCIFMQRLQYYYAWVLADAVCNLSGFGFNGFDENGEPKWDLVSNVDPYKVEMAFSFKETLDAWNCTTMYWLRRVAYDRVRPQFRTLSTYLLSAMWHGLFMGYYMTFMTGALLTISARIVRKCLRWRFQGSKQSRIFYDILTFLATKVALAYCTFPFATIHFNPGFFIYKRMFFFLHILAILAILILPKILPPPKAEQVNGEKRNIKEE